MKRVWYESCVCVCTQTHLCLCMCLDVCAVFVWLSLMCLLYLNHLVWSLSSQQRLHCAWKLSKAVFALVVVWMAVSVFALSVSVSLCLSVCHGCVLCCVLFGCCMLSPWDLSWLGAVLNQPTTHLTWLDLTDDLTDWLSLCLGLVLVWIIRLSVVSVDDSIMCNW